MNLSNTDQLSSTKIYFADSSVLHLANDLLGYVEKAAGKRSSCVIDVLLTSLWLMLNPKRFDVRADNAAFCEDEVKPPPPKDDLECSDRKPISIDPLQEIHQISESTKDNAQIQTSEEASELENIFKGQAKKMLQPSGRSVSPYTLPITSPISTASGEASNIEGFEQDKGDDSLLKHVKGTSFPAVNFRSLLSPNNGNVLPLINPDSPDPLILDHKTGLMSADKCTDLQNGSCIFPFLSSDINSTEVNGESDTNTNMNGSANSLKNYTGFDEAKPNCNTIPDMPTFHARSKSAFSSVDKSTEVAEQYNPPVLTNCLVPCYTGITQKTVDVCGSNSGNGEVDAPILTLEPSSTCTSSSFYPINKYITAHSSEKGMLETAPQLEKELVENITAKTLPANVENVAKYATVDDGVPELTAMTREPTPLYTIERVSPDPSDDDMHLECDNGSDMEKSDSEMVDDGDSEASDSTVTATGNGTINDKVPERNNMGLSESEFTSITLSELDKQELNDSTPDEYDGNVSLKEMDMHASEKRLSFIGITEIGPEVPDNLDSETTTQDGSSTCDYSSGMMNGDPDGDMCIKIVDVAGGVAFTDSDNSSDSYGFGQSFNMLSGKSTGMHNLLTSLDHANDSRKTTNTNVERSPCPRQLSNDMSNTAYADNGKEEITGVPQQRINSESISAVTDPRLRWQNAYLGSLAANPAVMSSLYQSSMLKALDSESNYVLESLLRARAGESILGTVVRSGADGVTVKTNPLQFNSVTSNPTWTLPTQSVTNSMSHNFQAPQFAVSPMFGGIETTSSSMEFPFSGSDVQARSVNKRPLTYVNNLGLTVQIPTKKTKMQSSVVTDVNMLSDTTCTIKPIMMMQNIHNSVSELPAVSQASGTVTSYTVDGDRRLSSGFEILMENAEESLEMSAPTFCVSQSQKKKDKKKKKIKQSRKKTKPDVDKEKYGKRMENHHSLRDGTVVLPLPGDGAGSTSHKALSKPVQNTSKVKNKIKNGVKTKTTPLHSHARNPKQKKALVLNTTCSKPKALVNIKHKTQVKKAQLKPKVSQEKKNISLPKKQAQMQQKNDRKTTVKGQTKVSENKHVNTNKLKPVSIPKITHSQKQTDKQAEKRLPELPENAAQPKTDNSPKKKGRSVKWKKKVKLANSTVGTNVKTDSFVEQTKILKHKAKSRRSGAVHQLSLARQLEDANELIVNTERGAKLAAQERLNVYSEFN